MSTNEGGCTLSGVHLLGGGTLHGEQVPESGTLLVATLTLG